MSMEPTDFASMTHVVIIAVPIAFALIVSGNLAFFVTRRVPRKLKADHFQTKWNEIQKLCGKKENWPQVVHEADALLDEALKKRRIRGKTMGERLVKVQRSLTDNDGVWFGHKLRNKIETDPETKLKEVDVKDALIGIRQALKDLGALPAAGAKADKADVAAADKTVTGIDKPEKAAAKTDAATAKPEKTEPAMKQGGLDALKKRGTFTRPSFARSAKPNEPSDGPKNSGVPDRAAPLASATKLIKPAKSDKRSTK